MGVYFSSRNNSTDLSSLAKVSFPVKSVIPWLAQKILTMQVPGTETFVQERKYMRLSWGWRKHQVSSDKDITGFSCMFVTAH